MVYASQTRCFVSGAPDSRLQLIRGRGVHYLEGDMQCPLSGVGTRGDHASIRLAFDDDASEATFDPSTRRLVVTNRRSYRDSTLFGDLIILGRGRTKSGAWVPVSMHTRFDKTGDRLKARPHLHPTVSGALAEVELEPIEVVVDGQRVLDPALAQRVATQPPLAEWLGRALFGIRSNRSLVARLLDPLGIELGHADAVVDLTVGLGVGRLAMPLVRAELHVPRQRGQHRELERDRSETLTAMLAGEQWMLRFTVLGSFRDLREHLGRAIVLLGLDHVSALRRIRDGQIARGDIIEFARRGTQGTVEVGRERATIDNIDDVARAFLEYDILGSVIAQAVIAGAPDEIVV